MNKVAKIYMGVDVSKKFLDIYLHPIEKILRITNNSEGLEILTKELLKYDIDRIVCEATGGYENLLVKTMRTCKYKTWRVEPRRINAFIISEGIKVKTDKCDAKMIALFAFKNQEAYKPQKSTNLSEKIKALTNRKAALNDMLVMEKNRLKHPYQSCTKSITKHIAFMEKEIDAIELKISVLIQKNIIMQKKLEIIQSIPGVGQVTAAILLAEVPELGKISNKQVAALVGVAPYTKQSGAWKGQSFISGGRYIPRKALFMAALTACRCNPKLREFYQRLRKAGKKPKLAIVAVMRKLIVIINIMLTRNIMWSIS